MLDAKPELESESESASAAQTSGTTAAAMGWQSNWWSISAP